MKIQPEADDRGLRLDHFLAQRLGNMTRSQIQHLNRTGSVHIDGRLEKSGYRVRGNETIEIDTTSLQPTSLSAEQIPLHIHFEDENLAVIEKPAGLVVHPGSGVRSGTVVNALLFHFRNLSDFAGEGRPGIVHRIDKWTSGLLVVAKNNTTHALLGKAFQARTVEKTYLALVHGKPSRPSGTIEVAIGRHPTIRTRMAARPNKGRIAHTEFVVTEAFREFSLLEVRIKTGRTHQIRVHLSSLGHPVVGDDVYGARFNNAFIQKYGKLNRYFLHAARLRFLHPCTKEVLDFHSPLPPELENFLSRIR